MLEVVEQEDGKFAVCDFGGATLNRTLGVFPNRREADEWMLQKAMIHTAHDQGLGVMLPGGNQGLS